MLESIDLARDVSNNPAIKIFRADASDGDDSMHSSEENDHVADASSRGDEVPPFRQVDYLWLFNPYYKFNERKGFVLEDASL